MNHLTADTFSSSVVVLAIEARGRAHGCRPAGAYWDACVDAVSMLVEQ